MCCITTHIEVGLLHQQFIDEFAVLLEQVLDVDLLFLLARKGVEDGQIVAEGFFEMLFHVNDFQSYTRSRDTYIPFILVKPILASLAAAVEQHSGTDTFTLLC